MSSIPVDTGFLVAAEQFAGARCHELAQYRQLYLDACYIGDRWAAIKAKRKAYAIMRGASLNAV